MKRHGEIHDWDQIEIGELYYFSPDYRFGLIGVSEPPPLFGPWTSLTPSQHSEWNNKITRKHDLWGKLGKNSKVLVIDKRICEVINPAFSAMQGNVFSMLHILFEENTYWFKVTNHMKLQLTKVSPNDEA